MGFITSHCKAHIREDIMYTVIVTKLPQEATDSIAQKYVKYTNLHRRTLVYSLDDLIRLLNNPLGNDRSHVEIVNKNDPSQIETIKVLDKLGIDWVSIDDNDGTVLKLQSNYSQNDPQWRDTPLGDGSVPSKTIGNWGCLGTVYTTMARYMGLCTDTPPMFNDRMVLHGAMQSIYVQAGALRTCFPNSIKYVGWFKNDIVDRCKAQIDKGIPVPARVDLNTSSGYTQHWVLITGYSDDNELMIADPYPFNSTEMWQKDTIYNTIYEVLIYDRVDNTPIDTIDLAPYFSTGSDKHSQLFELQTVGAGTERVQLKQYANGISHITKNDVYEELRVTHDRIQRSVDTSMDADHLYYLSYVGGFVDWLKRYMYIGEQFVSTPVVTVQRKSDCGVVSVNGTTDYLTLKKRHDVFVGLNNVILNDVIEVEWRKSASGEIEETYYFAKGLGLVGWGTNDGTGRVARISELHNVGDRPDNVEKLYCGWQ